MEPCPYKFDAKNPRLVEGAERPGLVHMGAAAIFLGSVAWYNKRFFRVDQNAMNMVAFTFAAMPASYTYSDFLFNSPETEAACINNARELQQ